ncbi:uncharacterized protein [Palaemon carinicauda]|uniref:uncharacterized protein n=1 Tax=Palaemon carinicauda TaxID=392227 RepID=UPI0035B618C9
MVEFNFDPAEFLGSADCLKFLPVLNKKQLVAYAQWLRVPLKSAGTKKDMLEAVRGKIAQDFAEAEHLVSESEINSDGEGSINDDLEEDRLSVRAGLTLFEDPPRVGVIYEGPSNIKANVSHNPFLPPLNSLPFKPLASVHTLGESKEEVEYKLICKLRRHEVEMVKLNIEMARLQGANLVSSPKGMFQERFNLGAALKLVPVFDENNVPEFFKAFERVATRLSWPSEMWTVLIQCRLVGKAIRVYNALEEGIARDYYNVKALVLKAYDLVPEAYRLKFRNYNKHPSQSFVEFARVNEEQFDDWLKSRQVVSFAALRELLLLEEFKKACSKELRVHLEEVKTMKLSSAAPLADEYVLTHRSGNSNFGYRVLNDPSSRAHSSERRGEPPSMTPNVPKNNNDSFSDGRNIGRVSGESPPPSVFVNRGCKEHSGNYVVLGGFPNTVVSAPLVDVRLSFPGCDKVTELAVVDSLPIPGIDGILGNDMVNNQGQELFPILSINACPIAVTTRAAARAADLLDVNDDLMFSSLEVDVERPGSVDSGSSIIINDLKPDWDRLAFIEAQKKEFDFELGDINDFTKPRFGITKGLLYRFSRPSTDDLNKTSQIAQIVVPSQFRESVMNLAHNNFLSGHFGIWKTFQKLARYFWWPGMKSSVKHYVKECEVCQVMGKPNQIIPKAPLHPIPPIGEPFSELVIDVVGPLPKTKYGLPRVIQTDCGTNFTSKLFRGKCAELAIQHITSVPYHPESQGVVERFHQTLKSILKKHCYEQGSEWDKALPFALFAIRNHPNSSTGVAPFELVFGHKIRGPLEISSEVLQSGRRGEVKVAEFVEDLKKRLFSAWKFAQENLSYSQAVMKDNFDR